MKKNKPTIPRISRKKDRLNSYKTRISSLMRKLGEISAISDTSYVLVAFDENNKLLLLSSEENFAESLESYFNYCGSCMVYRTEDYPLLKSGNDEQLTSKCSYIKGIEQGKTLSEKMEFERTGHKAEPEMNVASTANDIWSVYPQEEMTLDELLSKIEQIKEGS